MTSFLYFHGDPNSGSIAKNRLTYLATNSVSFAKVGGTFLDIHSRLEKFDDTVILAVFHATKMGSDLFTRLQNWDASLKERLLVIAASGEAQEVDEVASTLKKAGFSAWAYKKRFSELYGCNVWEELMTNLRDASAFQDAKQLLDDNIGALNGDPVDVKVSANHGRGTGDYSSGKISPEHFWNAVLILLKAARITLSPSYEEKMSGSIRASSLHGKMSQKAWWIESLGALHEDSVKSLFCPVDEVKNFVENLYVDSDRPVTIEMIQSATAFDQEIT